MPNRIEAVSAAEPHLTVTVIDELGWVQSVRIVVPAPLPVGIGVGGLSIGNADDDQTVLRIGFLTTECPSTVSVVLGKEGDLATVVLDGPRDACTNAIGFPRLIELDLDRALGAVGVEGQDLRP
jgi:hypothetical protein